MNPAVSLAAQWLADQGSDAPRPIIPTIRRQFDLSAAEAIEALREANDLRATNSQDPQ